MAVQTYAEPAPARVLLDAAREAAATLGPATDLPAPWGLPDAELEELLALAGSIRSAVERVEVSAVREGVRRGLHRGQGFGVVDWVRLVQSRAGLAPDPSHAARLNRVAALPDQAAGQPVWEAFCAATVGLGKADQLARFVADTAPVAEPSDLHDTVTVLTEAASDSSGESGLTPGELHAAVRRAGLLLKPERDLAREQDAARRGRALHRAAGPAGLTAYHLLLDPDASAVIDAAVAGLSEPVTGLDGEPDPRTAATRRADALVEVVRRGAGNPEGMPQTPKAQVVVTISYDQLEKGITGAGVTATDQVLSAADVRRLACDAGIIPMVLGSRGEVLDVGREQRLFSTAQRRALRQRDRGCTYPGCTIPAPWCDAHHVLWWSRGGTSSLDNAALLCGRHHTLVHQRDLTATVTDTGVTWHRGDP
ncbi:HNH endonuclease signature motif containing protein [Luteipulveratus flavus]|uniref:DUF222 domain-containing protein n=1 Tax=Luteipulveratus flavus TaxID=3031728 RepID=A0ABT6C9Z4_9MICO|nr:HNH endonuclease signature motif containing protein [Luteipulveratus sp. YIM 133296]MDF8265725.1 DUF222 domain-containing protein [Luteipulveratus sp. YIM 133296]